MRLVASCLSKVINQNVLNTYIQQEYQKETMPGIFFFLQFVVFVKNIAVILHINLLRRGKASFVFH